MPQLLCMYTNQVRKSVIALRFKDDNQGHDPNYTVAQGSATGLSCVLACQLAQQCTLCAYNAPLHKTDLVVLAENELAAESVFTWLACNTLL